MASKEVAGKEIIPWAISHKEVISHFKSSENGLNEEEAEKRLGEQGYNEISERERRTGLHIFLSQFKNVFILILIACSIISYFLGEKVNAMVILAMILLSSLLGFFQEYKAEKTLRELKKYITLKAKVMRNNKIIEIDSKELVLGDVVYLDIGDIVPADMRLIKIEELTVNESSLTGESLPVIKKMSLIDEKRAMPQYLSNMMFTGTSVSSGTAYGIVTATGKNTFFGKTAAFLKEETKTDFEKSIRKFGNFLLIVIISMTSFVFAANAILGKEILDSFLFALALAVGITPEILPVIMTITLSKGAIKMAKDKVVVKKLSSIEDLGNIDTLCCDKTGTLTEGTISLRHHFNLENINDMKVILYGLLCNSVEETGTSSFADPIDKAIWKHENVSHLKNELKKYKILGENELDFERRIMSILLKNTTDGKNILIAKGAPESILKVCRYAMINENKRILNRNLLSKIKNQIIDYEKEGYKVIAVAERLTEKKKTAIADEKDLTLIGFLLFIDPVKKTAKEALEKMEKMGVNIKILSGDSPLVTRKICNDVGLKIIENKVITGDDLEKLNEAEFEEYVYRYSVFARVTPEQKQRIVSTLNKEGHIVGFLGDGINDAPALKAADVGISVESGAGIAKDASDIILLQKSLHVLAQGIHEGRRTFSNITKYILNTISANYGNMFTVSISSLFMKFLPLLPSQILLNNFISDVPNLTISTDNVDEKLMKKPKRWDFGFISKFMIYFGLISSIFDLILIFGLIYLIKTPIETFRTAWFVESALSEIVIVFAIRTTKPFFKSRPSTLLIVSSILSALVVILITYTLFGNILFEFVGMPLSILAFIGAILLTYFITVEIVKRHFFKKIEM